MSKNPHHGNMATRTEPEKCRGQDLGLFEIISRDSYARIGRLHTAHGLMTTPMLLPVVNPNIRTIEPREMWEKYGIEALITNSYVIWKHEDLRTEAKKNGIHQLIDFPGIIVTDSGTFQSYIYGDVEVGVEEIIQFQKDIGVDIGTILDVFGRPDMPFDELDKSVIETSSRAKKSLEVSGEKLLLNGPIQGGTYQELRIKSAQLMSELQGPFRGFTIHPIGGIVPLMEQQRYKELFSILIASKSSLPPDRPIHLFGCGHPLLFPLSIALGVDIFDSAAYAIFARDDRILTPTGTLKLDDLKEWPFSSNALFGTTPAQVRSMNKEEKTILLSHHNLEVTQAELARCREAIRMGTIWQLAEQRSHSSPQLREAFEWILDQLDNPEEGPIGDTILELMGSSNPIRSGGEQISEDIEFRPHILHIQALLATRWRFPGSWWNGKSGPPERVIILEGFQPPWRNSAKEKIIQLLDEIPETVILILTPLGLIPYTIEDLSPWCHLNGPNDMWNDSLFDYEVEELLSELGLSSYSYTIINKNDEDISEVKTSPEIRKWLDRCSIVDKLSILCGLHPLEGCKFTENMTSRKSSTDRMVNIFSDEKHVLSPRLTDGGISLTIDGAKKLLDLNQNPLPDFNQLPSDEIFPGIPRVRIVDDAIPFVGKGRNVMHGYILGADPHLIPGQQCIVISSSGELIAHGIAITTSLEMRYMKKGIAVKVKNGNL